MIRNVLDDVIMRLKRIDTSWGNDLTRTIRLRKPKEQKEYIWFYRRYTLAGKVILLRKTRMGGISPDALLKQTS